MKWRARQVLRSQIKYHTHMRDMYRYAVTHGMCTESFNHTVYVENMTSKAAFEQRYIDRLTRLLNKYL